jgi:hypothetical protein
MMVRFRKEVFLRTRYYGNTLLSMATLIARETLAASRLFVAQAASAKDDITAFRYNLEAAIVFARSVTLHVQKDLKKRPGFDDWYSAWQERLGKNTLAKYFLEKRNFVLKQGPVGLRQDATVIVHGGFELRAELGVTVIRGQPWYRRTLTVLWDDLTWPMRKWLAKRRAAARTRSSAPSTGGPVVRTSLHRGFVDLRSDEPGLKVFSEYLDLLDELVADAEKRFA